LDSTITTTTSTASSATATLATSSKQVMPPEPYFGNVFRKWCTPAALGLVFKMMLAMS
jgi:hypothetical protein